MAEIVGLRMRQFDVRVMRRTTLEDTEDTDNCIPNKDAEIIRRAFSAGRLSIYRSR